MATRKYNRNANPFITHAPIIGRRLYAVAVQLARQNYNTRHRYIPAAEIKRQVRACRGRKRLIAGSQSVDAAAAHVEHAINAIIEARRTRPGNRCSLAHMHKWSTSQRYQRKLPGRPSRHKPAPQVIAPWEHGTVAERLNTKIERAFANTAERSLPGRWAAGGCYVHIQTTRRWDMIDATMVRHYAHGRRWPKLCVEYHITLPTNWLSHVHNEGLAVADGMVTLAAEQHAYETMARPSGGARPIIGITTFRAFWMQAGRGYNHHVVNGYIARANVGGRHEFYHSNTAEQAVRGVKDRIIGYRLADDISLATLDLGAIAHHYGHMRVTLAVSKRAGNCESGSRDWAARVGLDADAGCTLAELIEADKRLPHPGVLRVVQILLQRQQATA